MLLTDKVLSIYHSEDFDKSDHLKGQIFFFFFAESSLI